MRKEALAKRNGLPQNLRDAYSQLIRKRVVAHLESVGASTVHCYLNFGSEVITTGIISDLIERRITVVVPIIRKQGEAEVMSHSILRTLDNLHSGTFGIPEPDTVEEVSRSNFDAVLMPVVAYDGDGMRLGYGRGFYDRFLTTLGTKTPKVGLAFSQQELDKIPMLSHDQLMSSLVNENSNFIFK
ncbi:MAG: 5-formyltetrahydrofolate cyclo-ligase [bacterium]